MAVLILWVASKGVFSPSPPFLYQRLHMYEYGALAPIPAFLYWIPGLLVEWNFHGFGKSRVVFYVLRKNNCRKGVTYSRS